MNDILRAATHRGEVRFSADGDCWRFVACETGICHISLGEEHIRLDEQTVLIVPPGLAFTCSGACILLAVQNLSAPCPQPHLFRGEPAELVRSVMTAVLWHSPLSGHHTFIILYGQLLACYVRADQSDIVSSQVVKDIRQHIAAHYNDPAYHLDAYLRTLPFNYDYLRKRFQQEIGQTPHQFLMQLRLGTAALILASEEGRSGGIADIAHRCGFKEPLYFSRAFKKYYGVSPTAYMEAARPVNLPADA